MPTDKTRFQKTLTQRLAKISEKEEISDEELSDVVQSMMVDVRKVIEHGDKRKIYRVAAFYCDWLLHTSINKNEVACEIIEHLNDLIQNQREPSVRVISDALRLSQLRSELIEVCKFCEADADFVIDDDVWNVMRHHILRILCEIPLSISVKKLKSMVKKYPGATAAISSVFISEESGSPIMNEDDYYWKIAFTDLSELNASQYIIGAVVL